MTIVEDAPANHWLSTRWRTVIRTAGLRGHALRVGLLTAAAAAVYATLGLVKLHTFKASTFDLVIFDQMVRGFAAFGAPTSAARGISLDQGMHFVQLGRALLTDPGAARALLLGLRRAADADRRPGGAIRRWPSRSSGRSPGGCSAPSPPISWPWRTRCRWPIAQAANFDFHEVAFVPAAHLRS